MWSNLKAVNGDLKKSKRGITPIEIIIVLIIVAILAVAAIPSIFKFVGDAQNRSLIASARSVYVASEYVVDVTVAQGGTLPEDNNIDSEDTALYNKIMNRAALSGITYTFTANIENDKVSSLVYTQDGTTITIHPNDTDGKRVLIDGIPA